MTLFDLLGWLIIGLGVLVGVTVGAYLVGRAFSLGWFRTRRESMKSLFRDLDEKD